MITVTETPYEVGNVKAVHQIFKESGFKLLEEAILGKQTKHSVEAIKLALEAKTFEAKKESSEAELKQALRYQTTLEVLREMKESKSFDFVVTKTVTPNNT